MMDLALRLAGWALAPVVDLALRLARVPLLIPVDTDPKDTPR
ncbi:hypothetical protein HOT45_gp59 [Gordonia phage Trine]|uniref:Uncharacterized protein n=1 Tax=Gordonia phage Trine TaxID=2201431 RepID=A0A2Z4Q9C2_9CAUD|nr:hypothetical protein HOT45_gp59 [Gordonia phage Trine]AWY06560.1 hypothetical protein PBI_TRINE_59 [Gordonia phage Trine]